MNPRVLATLAAALVVGGCSDSTGPHVTLPSAGVYVLGTINGASLPNDAVYPSYVTVAETLFVAPDHSYFVAGTYFARYVSSFYQVSTRHTFQVSADSVIAPALGQGANGLGSFGAAVITLLGDTLVAAYPSGGITRYLRVPTPTQPGPVASLTLTATDVLLFQGGAVDVQGLVLRGLDANGLWIVHPVPSVHVTPPPGWTASGTVLTSPVSAESEATINVVSGNASTPLTVRSVMDLRSRKWKFSWSCGNGLRRYAIYPPSVYVDSLSVSATVDSVTYYHPDLYVKYDARFWLRPTLVQYLSDGEIRTSTPAAGSALALVTVRRLAPDSVVYSLPAELYGAHPTQDSVAVATQRTPRIYTGGSFCATDSFGSYHPAILSELP